MNRIEIKNKAKSMLKGNLWNLIIPILIVLGITSGILIIPQLFGVTIYNYDETLTNAGVILNLISSIVSVILSVGVITYVLGFVRNKEFKINNIFEGFKEKIVLILVTSLLAYIFICLWTILFIIPGIIATFSYAMIYYILADKKQSEVGPMEVLKKSKAMMKGYKWDYFVFQLSFFGWLLLSCLTLGILYIWVGPYMMVASALYYENLKEIQKEAI